MSPSRFRVLLVVATAAAPVLVLACGGDDGSHTDSGIADDGGMPMPDGAINEDAGERTDGALPDADEDGDGIVVAMDCDDTDPSVGRNAVRSCSSECATGTEACTDGEWSSCSATTDCTCEMPGTMRTIECGRCGIASQRCGEDGRWEMPSECFDEQECFAGEVERELGMCGERARICDDTCHWRDWMVVTEPGECAAGEVERTAMGCPPGELFERRCNDACMWEDFGCTAGCTRPSMPSASGADPVCIPAGPFILGDSTMSDASPVRTITLSEFYIDRFPVTKARYEMCRSAGACGDPTDTTEYDAIADDEFVIRVSMDDLFAFCTWDGGSLVTEYQWEKAARGPDPDSRPHPWGSETAEDCRFHTWVGCHGYPFPITWFPMNVSPYGVRLMGALTERTSSRYMDYSAIPDTDPVGSSDPDERYMVRAHRWFRLGMGGTRTLSSTTSNRFPNYNHTESGFRCVY